MARLLYVSAIWKCDCGEHLRVLEIVAPDVTEFPGYPTEMDAIAAGWRNPDRGVYVCPECAKEE